MKRIYGLKRVFMILAMAIAVAGCEVGDMQPSIAYPPINIPPDDGWEDDTNTGSPKSPVPIKPKRNPDGKIQRPKLVEDLINNIISR